MFREQQNRILVLFWILLSQVLHGFNQHTLALDIAGIGRTIAPPARGGLRQDGNGENFGHANTIEPSLLRRNPVLQRCNCRGSMKLVEANSRHSGSRSRRELPKMPRLKIAKIEVWQCATRRASEDSQAPGIKS